MNVEPTQIQLIQSKNDDKYDRYFINIKLRRDPTSEKLNLYELKMAFFDNNDPEELLLFVCNFNMTLKKSVTLQLAQRFNKFVRCYVEKHYVSFTHFLLR